MKHCYIIFLLLLYSFALPIFSQPDSLLPTSNIPKPDYRNHINIPEYDPSLMPLKTVRTGTGVWTELNPKVPRVDYLGIHFINKDTGWACGANGAIIKTTNGGASWSIPNSSVTNVLTHINSYNGNVVIAVSLGGKIVRSSDQGESWTEVSSGSTRDLWCVKMLNDTLGWISGTSATLLKTTDAGLNWQSVNAGLNQSYWSLDFLNEKYGMIACGSGIVLRTTNSGTAWIQIQAGDSRDLFTIDIIDSLHIAAAGGPYGKNVYSSDGGATWVQNTDLIYENGVNCISFIDADTGYTIGENWGLRKTTNKGQSWFIPPTQILSDWWICLLLDGIGYAAGSDLWLYKTEIDYDNWERLFLNDDLVDVHFIDETTGYAVGTTWNGYPCLKTTDGGISWKHIGSFPSALFVGQLSCIKFTDNMTGFVGGTSTMVKTTDEGNTWYQPVGIPGGIRKIFFISHSMGWAISGRSILKTSDEGENWVVQITLPSDSYTSIYFIDSLNGWATSRYIWQTTNGGTNWIQRTDIQILFSLDVFFKDYINGFAIASNEFYSTLNGGVNWTLNPSITGFSIAGKLVHYKSNPIFVIGYRTYRSIDSGINWFDFNELTGKRINGLSLLGMGLGYAAGEFGLVLKYYDETIPVELIGFNAEIEGKYVFLN